MTSSKYLFGNLISITLLGVRNYFAPLTIRARTVEVHVTHGAVDGPLQIPFVFQAVHIHRPGPSHSIFELTELQRWSGVDGILLFLENNTHIFDMYRQ